MDPESGSIDLIEFGSNPDPDPNTDLNSGKHFLQAKSMKPIKKVFNSKILLKSVLRIHDRGVDPDPCL